MPFAVATRLLIGRERLIEVVQADEADGKVAQRNRHVGWSPDPRQRPLGAAIERQRFFEAILTIEDVGQVGIEPRESEPIARTFENRAGPPRPRLRGRVPAEIDERLQAAAARDRFFVGLPRFAKSPDGGSIRDDRRVGSPFEQEHVRHRAQRPAGRMVAADRGGKPLGRLGEPLRLRKVDPAADRNQIGDPLEQRGVAGHPRSIERSTSQLLVGGRRERFDEAICGGHVPNPA